MRWDLVVLLNQSVSWLLQSVSSRNETGQVCPEATGSCYEPNPLLKISDSNDMFITDPCKSEGLLENKSIEYPSVD